MSLSLFDVIYHSNIYKYMWKYGNGMFSRISVQEVERVNTDSDNINASKSNSTKSKQRTKEAKPGEPNIPELPRIIQLPASAHDINDMRSAVFIHIYQDLPYSTCFSFISHCSLKTQGSLLSPSGLVLRSHHPPQVAHANSSRQVCHLEMMGFQVRNLRISNRSPMFRFQPFVLGGKIEY